MRAHIKPIIVIFVAFACLFLAPSARADNPNMKPCLAGDYRVYPLRDIIWSDTERTSKFLLYYGKEFLTNDDLYFNEVDLREKIQQAYQLALMDVPEQLHPIHKLAAIHEWTQGIGLGQFFTEHEADLAEEALDILKREGLNEHAALIQEGMSYFSTPYPSYPSYHQRHSKWEINGKVNEDFVKKLKELSERYRPLEDLFDLAIEKVKRDPKLLKYYNQKRQELSEEKKFSRLTSTLSNCVISSELDDDSVDLNAVRQLPLPLQDIYLVLGFSWEAYFKPLSQYLKLSEGGEFVMLVAALKRMSLVEEAETIQAAVDMFQKPYPIEIEERWALLKKQSDEFNSRLDELGERIDYEKLQKLMIEKAYQYDVMPK